MYIHLYFKKEISTSLKIPLFNSTLFTVYTVFENFH